MRITINEPCTENWNAMTATEKGAFCQVCAKDVIDFTHRSPEEIRDMLGTALSSKQKVCGRITNAQLDQFNDEFPGWRNEREAFRTVFVFSLIAVFGLTLFSCSSTASKEIVDQLNVQASELLVADSLVAVDSVKTVSMGEVVAVDPKDVVTDTTSSPDLDSLNINEIPITSPRLLKEYEEICVWMGDIVTSGFVGIDPSDKNLISLLETPVIIPQPVPLYAGSPRSNTPLPRPERSANNSQEAIPNKENLAFEGELFPNPVTVESRLYLTVYQELEMSFQFFQPTEETVFRKGESAFKPGNHVVDLRLHRIPPGAYDLELTGLNQRLRIPFSV